MQTKVKAFLEITMNIKEENRAAAASRRSAIRRARLARAHRGAGPGRPSFREIFARLESPLDRLQSGGL